MVAVAATLGVSLPEPRILPGKRSVITLSVVTSVSMLAACSVENAAWGVGLMALAALPLLYIPMRRYQRAGMPLLLHLQESVVPVWPFATLLVAAHVDRGDHLSGLATLLFLPLGLVVAGWVKSRYDWARTERVAWDDLKMDREFANTWFAVAPLGVACLLAIVPTGALQQS